jgi:hypothetical protein
MPSEDQVAMVKPALSGIDTELPARRTTALGAALGSAGGGANVAMSPSFGPKKADSQASGTTVVPSPNGLHRPTPLPAAPIV